MYSKSSTELQGVITQMLKPLQGISLGIVVEGLAGFRIIPFNKKSKDDNELLKDLKLAVKNAVIEINNYGISAAKAMDVSESIEPIIINAFNAVGFKAGISKTADEDEPNGYPAIEFIDKLGRINYLECKTYHIDNVVSTQTSFNLTPSEGFTIAADAHHFVLSFETFVSARTRNENVYKCKSWHIASLDKLQCDIKYEFNSNNRRLNAKELIIAEGEL